MVYDKLDGVVLPTEKGSAEVLPQHAEYLTLIVPGEVTCLRSSGKEERILVSGGICHVHEDIVNVIL